MRRALLPDRGAVAKLVSAVCPRCGAPVQIPATADHVTCQYCNTSAFVQRARGVTPPANEPVIVVKSVSPIGPIFFAIGLSLLGLVSTAVILLTNKPHTNIEPEGAQAAQDATQAATEAIKSALGGIKPSALGPGGRFYFGDQPMPFDVNGDGTLDIVGLSKTPSSDAWLAAYDGRDGKQLWRSGALEKDQKDASALHGLVHDQVVVVDALGKIQAYRAKNGQPAWAALLGERAQELCEGADFVRITAADRKKHDFELATGHERTLDAKATCSSVPQSRGDHGRGFEVIGWSDFSEYGLPGLHAIPEMSAHRALVTSDRKRAFMLGSKESGSSVAMIAAVKSGKVLWKDVVPGVDPLNTTVNVTTQSAAYANGRVVVPYSLRGSTGVRMAAFDADSGKRLWDIAIHDKSQVSSGLQMTDTDVYYASWTALYVLRADTGELRFRVGTEF